MTGKQTLIESVDALIYADDLDYEIYSSLRRHARDVVTSKDGFLAWLCTVVGVQTASPARLHTAQYSIMGCKSVLFTTTTTYANKTLYREPLG